MLECCRCVRAVRKQNTNNNKNNNNNTREWVWTSPRQHQLAHCWHCGAVALRAREAGERSTHPPYITCSQGELAPDVLVGLSTAELASREVSAARQRKAEEMAKAKFLDEGKRG